MKLTMTMSEACVRKDRAWKAFLVWRNQIVKAFFPNTGGSEHLMHNWYRCSSDPKLSALADWVFDTTWARWHRIEDGMKSRSAAREHLRHGKDFKPQWCPFCTPKH